MASRPKAGPFDWRGGSADSPWTAEAMRPAAAGKDNRLIDRTLDLGKDLHVPRAVAARTVFIAGTKGSGKTYTGGVMAEEMLAAGVHVVVLDPLGVWWASATTSAAGRAGSRS